MTIYSSILKTKPHNSYYLNKYINFINRCQIRKLDKNIYTEKHHICPKANDLFPEYSSIKTFPWNNIALTSREHFLAHWILWKAFGGSQMFAFYAMSNHGNKKTSKVYEELKKQYIIKQTGRVVSEETKNRMRKPKPSGFGEKVRQRMAGVPKTKEAVEKMGKSHKGLKKFTEERKILVSIAMTGSGNIMYGKQHKDSSKSIMREKKLGINCGKKWFNDGHTVFRAFPHEAKPDWKLGRVICN